MLIHILLYTSVVHLRACPCERCKNLAITWDISRVFELTKLLGSLGSDIHDIDSYLIQCSIGRSSSSIDLGKRVSGSLT